MERRAWTRFFAVGTALVALPVLAQVESRRMTATAVAHDALQLTPSVSAVTRTLIVDAAPALMLSVVAASRTLNVSLLAPNGVRYRIGDPDTSSFSSVIVPIDSTTTRPGASYVASIANPMSGNWSLTVSETAALTTPLDVVATAFFGNSTRAILAGGGETYPVDAAVRLAVVAFDNTARLGGLTISARLFRPSDPTFTPVAVQFRDDGTSGDEVAGDRIYGALITPAAVGNYQVQADITGVASTGSFRRTAAAELQIVRHDSHIISFIDRGIDDDFDGLYEVIRIAPAATIGEAGRYAMSVVLRASNGKTFQRTSSRVLSIGSSSVNVDFDALDISRELGVGGPYAVSEVRLLRDNGTDLIPADIRYDLGFTAAYSLSDIQHPRIRLSGQGTSRGIDTDGNRKYEALEIQIGLIVDFAGDYTGSASLTDRNGKEIGFASGTVTLDEGLSTIVIVFDGETIGANRIDGPYVLSNLIFYGEGQSLIVNRAFITAAFRASDFEGYPPLSKRRSARH